MKASERFSFAAATLVKTSLPQSELELELEHRQGVIDATEPNGTRG